MTVDDAAETVFSGKRIMIVEDEILLALDLELMLKDEGVEVLGPVGNIAQALDLLSHHSPDAVILDMNLGGKSSAPIVAELMQGDIPFVVTSGYSETYADIPAASEVPFVRKPYVMPELLGVLRSILSATTRG